MAAPTGGQQADEPEERRTITIDSRSTPVASTMGQITDRLLSTGSCFNRMEQLVVVREQSISPVLSSAELTGLLNQHVEFYFVNEDGGEYKPLPTSYANTWLNNVGQRERLPAIRLFSHNPIYTADWRLVSPGFRSPIGFLLRRAEHRTRRGDQASRYVVARFLLEKANGSHKLHRYLVNGLLVSRFIGSKQPYCSTVINPNWANRFSHKFWQSYEMAIMWKPPRTTPTTKSSKSVSERLSVMASPPSSLITPRPVAAIQR